jgi:hypothetical protein
MPNVTDIVHLFFIFRKNLLMNESSLLINKPPDDTLKYQATTSEELVQPTGKDYFKPSRPLSAIKFDYEAVYVKPATNSAVDIDDDQDEEDDEDFMTKVIRILDLTAEVRACGCIPWQLIAPGISLTGSRETSVLVFVARADRVDVDREGILQDGDR